VTITNWGKASHAGDHATRTVKAGVRTAELFVFGMRSVLERFARLLTDCHRFVTCTLYSSLLE